jgi:hypothetical protein
VTDRPLRANPAGEDLRVAALDALGALQDPGILDMDPRQLLNEASIPVRRAVLRALGELGDPSANQLLTDVLREERDPSLRLSALDALGKTGGLELADMLVLHMSRGEPDEAVREKAWQTYMAVLLKGSDQQLLDESRRFRNEPERRIEVLRVLCNKLEKAKQPADLALQRQQLGAELLKLQKPRPAEAARFFQQALDYWLTSNEAGGPLAVEELTRLQLLAWLAAEEYAAAIDFAEQAMARNPAHQDTVGPIIKNEADKLRLDKQFQKAMALIKEALTMSPPLDAARQADLKRIQEEINKEINANPTGANPTPAAVTSTP